MKKKLLLVSSAVLLSASVAFAQKVVTGRVTDTSGAALQGAVVRVEGTRVVAYTDAQGNFRLPNVPNSAKKVTISYIGMETRTVNVANTINVALEDLSELGEAVVVGYGTAQRLGTVSGAISSVTSKQIENKPVANVVDALQGKVAGVSIYTSTGEPGGYSSITVRGVGTITGNSEPLYIIDGVMVTAATVRALSPNDIASVTVLKDASATSIYGARAANGVVVYTTKKGTRGSIGTFQADLKMGWSNMASSKLSDNMMNASELEALWRSFEEQGALRAGWVNNYLNTYNQSRDFNWKDYIYKPNRKTYEGNLSYSGGSEKTDYYVGFNLFKSEGLAYRSKYNRYSAKMSLNSAVRSWLNTGVNINLTYNETAATPDGANNISGGLFYMLSPFWSPFDANGKEYYGQLVPGWNRYSLKYRGDMFEYENNIVNLTGSTFFELIPIRGLRIKTQNSIDAYDQSIDRKRSANYVGALANGYNQKGRNRKYQYQTTNTIEYKFDFNDVHRFTVLLGQEWMNYNYETVDANGEGISDDRLGELGSATGTKTISSSHSKYSYLSYFGRLNYNYSNKYFGDVTFRNDNTSLLPKDTRSGWFFSLGGRWRMKEEPFLKPYTWIDRLDVRSSYGTQGRTSIGPYEYYSLVGATRYAGNSGWKISTFGNDQLKWESQRQFSFGVDFEALKRRLNATFDFYVKNNVDLLMDVPQPYTSGVTSMTSNSGSIRNTGVEFSLSYEVFRNKDWSIEPYVNFSYNKEKITKLFPSASDNGRYWARAESSTIWIKGKGRGYYMPIWAGVNPMTGEPQWYLPGDDPTVTTKDPSRVTSVYNQDALAQYVGDYAHMEPNWTGGWGLRVQWKGLSLNMDFVFQVNKYLCNNDGMFAKNPLQFFSYNTHKSVANYWKQPGDQAEYPSLNYKFTEFDSRLLEDASFMRMKNITLAYELPKSVITRTRFIRGARVYVTGRNLLTWTSYTGLDPEVNSNLTYGRYPNTKQVLLGLSLTF